MPSLMEDLRKLRKLKKERDEKKALYSKADDEFRRFQQRVYDRMEAEEAGSFTDKRTKTLFVPTETVTAAIQDRQEFIRWALENDPSLVQEKEREAELNQLVRERLDNGEPLPPGVGLGVRQYISQRAA